MTCLRATATIPCPPGAAPPITPTEATATAISHPCILIRRRSGATLARAASLTGVAASPARAAPTTTTTTTNHPPAMTILANTNISCQDTQLKDTKICQTKKQDLLETTSQSMPLSVCAKVHAKKENKERLKKNQQLKKRDLENVDQWNIGTDYILLRRATMKESRLLTLSVSLDQGSFQIINSIASCGLKATASNLKIHLAQGVKTIGCQDKDKVKWFESRLKFIEAVRAELFYSPHTNITSVQSVLTANGEDTALVVAELSLSGAASRTVHELFSNKRWVELSQFPLHLEVGECKSGCVGTTLHMIPPLLVQRCLCIEASSLLVSLPPLRDDLTQENNTTLNDQAIETCDRLNEEGCGAIVTRAETELTRKQKDINENSGLLDRCQSTKDDTEKMTIEGLLHAASWAAKNIQAVCSTVARMDHELEERGFSLSHPCSASNK